MVDKSATVGKHTIIFHPELDNIYGCVIGQSCRIGAFVEIKPDVTIGNSVKIEPFVFIPNGVTIENNVFIGPHVTFTNDRHPRSTNNDGSIKRSTDWQLEKTVVKQGASIGAGATILCGITIGEHAVIGAGSVVTKNVPPGVTVIGNPARILKK
jgi:UDP-2-acetamido-3-amino-2,3-dideoxy-glucuronate N-acetyltransferase